LLQALYPAGRGPAIAALTLAFAFFMSSTPVGAQDYPNILLIIADDFGVEQLGAYGVGSDPAPTPALDRLAEEGVLFRNAWSNPVCSSTRATIQTGLYSFRTGIGSTVDPPELGLRQEDEFTIAEIVELSPGDYTTAAFGKWHLNGEEFPGGYGLDAVNVAGFEHFEGMMRNLEVWLGGTYFSYEKVENGVATDLVNAYATSDTVDWAIDFLETAPEPWFSYVAFHAPHSPYHRPPDELHSQSGCIDGQSGDERSCFKAMIEAMDTEIERLMLNVITDRPTVVLFLGDNGTAGEVIDPPFSSERAKGTLWEGGINVPFIVWYPEGYPSDESDALVNTSDLYATIAELVGIDTSGVIVLDSVSLVPHLEGVPHPDPRELAYSEIFVPNGCSANFRGGQAIRDDQYKLLRVPDIQGGGERFYNLENDRWESDNLLPNLSNSEQSAYNALSAAIDAVVRLEGEACEYNRQCCSRSCNAGICD